MLDYWHFEGWKIYQSEYFKEAEKIHKDFGVNYDISEEIKQKWENIKNLHLDFYLNFKTEEEIKLEEKKEKLQLELLEKKEEWEKVNIDSLEPKERVKFLMKKSLFLIRVEEVDIEDKTRFIEKYFDFNIVKYLSRHQLYRQNGLPKELNDIIENDFLDEWLKSSEQFKDFEPKIRKRLIRGEINTYIRHIDNLRYHRNEVKRLKWELTEIETKKKEELKDKEWEDYLNNKTLPNIVYIKEELLEINKELPALPKSKLTKIKEKIKAKTLKMVDKIKQRKEVKELNKFIARVQVITTKS